MSTTISTPVRWEHFLLGAEGASLVLIGAAAVVGFGTPLGANQCDPIPAALVIASMVSLTLALFQIVPALFGLVRLGRGVGQWYTRRTTDALGTPLLLTTGAIVVFMTGAGVGLAVAFRHFCIPF